MSFVKPSITFILLSHNDDISLVTRVNEYLKSGINLASLLVVDSGNINRLDKIFLEQLLNTENIEVIDQESSGIYESMNSAIKKIKTSHYIILGLDDIFFFNKILDILSHLSKDIIFLGVRKGEKDLSYLNLKNLPYSPAGIFPSHTAGAVISKKMHYKYGFYNTDFKVSSDLLFLTNCIQNGAEITLLKDIYAVIGDQGFSKSNEILSEYESHFIRLKLGANSIYSIYLMIFRIFKRYIKRIINK